MNTYDQQRAFCSREAVAASNACNAVTCRIRCQELNSCVDQLGSESVLLRVANSLIKIMKCGSIAVQYRGIGLSARVSDGVSLLPSDNRFIAVTRAAFHSILAWLSVACRAFMRALARSMSLRSEVYNGRRSLRQNSTMLLPVFLFKDRASMPNSL